MTGVHPAHIEMRKLRNATVEVTVHITREWKIRQAIGLFFFKVALWIGAVVMGFNVEIQTEEGTASGGIKEPIL